jgi:predicted nucleic acid-binding protein
VGARRARAVVLDAGALIAFERNDRKVRRLVELSIELATPLHVSTAVVAQIWRDGARQARLARLLRGEALEAHPLDLDDARAVGAICGASATSDVVDAHVVLLARRFGAVVVTSDREDIERLDPSLAIIAC